MVPLDDIHGLILRSYGMDCAAFFLLRVKNAMGARRTLESLTITPGTVWEQKPAFCVNVALTYEELAALGVAGSSLDSFPREFAAGAFSRCAEVRGPARLIAGSTVWVSRGYMRLCCFSLKAMQSVKPRLRF